MFKTQNFCHIASNNRNQVKVGVFVYRTTDSLATVLTSGYFNDRIIDINLHDLIIHEKVDSADATKVERNLLCVTERTLENVGTSVIKSKWEGDIEQEIADIEQEIADIEQEIAGLGNDFVKTDGSSVMTGPLKFRAGSMRGAIAPYLNGVSFWKMDSQGNITNIANLTDSQFTAVTTNSIDFGNTTHTWKDAYISRVITAVINNGYDIAVPVTNSADTLALKSQVDDAANSGEQLYSTGVWYAKMYAATVVPTGAEYDGRNYADFSQVDSDNNPVIKIYTGASGAWTLTETITPPATHNGYITVTSKIWDIAEQSGQQGGTVLWSWNSKTFTPYPRIVSFDSIHVTGDSTVVMPVSPTDNSIPNKKYVDDAVSGSHYHPDLFAWQWADHELDNMQWLRADTFSWQDGTVYENAYQHLVDDICIPVYAWTRSDGVVTRYTTSDNPQPYDSMYFIYNGYLNFAEDIQDISGDTITTLGGNVFYRNSSEDTVAAPTQAHRSTETISGVTIYYYLSADGHKICLANQESSVAAIYAATGVAWYYILDTVNQRFKLPRTKFGVTGLRDTVGNYVEAGLPNITGSYDYPHLNDVTTSSHLTGAMYIKSVSGDNRRLSSEGGGSPGGLGFDASRSSSVYGNSNTVQPRATQMYLYFYVGSFTQEAVENTAGLNAELFNGKADISLANLSAAGKKVCANLAMPGNTKTELTLGATGTTYTAPADGYVYFEGGATSGTKYGNITNTNNNMSTAGVSVSGISNVKLYLPVKKGDVFRVSYSLDTAFSFIFIYANGAQ